ncbi:ankyrin repeat domain-containing protein 17-like [Haliotis rufescens]|uniref:ankyrin repeat domain-containing protein 17-like n=1 Tax=Haliotis rufescens TaxID=6454 RepID=UPI00201F1557|nr:ankyrin repeat domain-containing protein 17-like [Haliotis rufescens]
MMTLCSSDSLQLALTATVYILLELSTCSTKECGLQMTEKMKVRSVVLRSIDITLCQLYCQDDFIFASCHKSKKMKKTGGSSVLSQNHPHALTTTSASNVGTLTSRCPKIVQATRPSLDCEDIHDACEQGNPDAVRWILSKRGFLDVNCRMRGMTPLMKAAEEGYRDILELLVNGGADVSLVTGDCDTILHLACYGGDMEAVKYILSLNVVDFSNSRGMKNRTPVMAAAYPGHRDVVEHLLGQGADVTLVDDYGDTILHLACRGGDVETVTILMYQSMVDIDARNKKGQTPADVARDKGHQYVSELVSSGAI